MVQKEKRESFRIKKSITAVCSFRGNELKASWMDSPILNLSEAGICILTEKKLTAKQTLRMRLFLSHTPRKTLQLQGTVVTSQKTLSGAHLTGVAFIHVTDKALRMLRTYIAWVLTKKEEHYGLSGSRKTQKRPNKG